VKGKKIRGSKRKFTGWGAKPAAAAFRGVGKPCRCLRKKQGCLGGGWIWILYRTKVEAKRGMAWWVEQIGEGNGMGGRPPGKKPHRGGRQSEGEFGRKRHIEQIAEIKRHRQWYLDGDDEEQRV